MTRSIRHRLPNSSRALATVVAGSVIVALAACSNRPSEVAGEQHTTAASGFGLGPENFRSNGGAFGPDQLSR